MMGADNTRRGHGRLQLRPARALACAASIVLCGCAAEDGVDVEEQAGDTTSVVSRAGPSWASDRLASIDLVIGAADGADEYTFGRLEPIALTSDAGVVVYDQMYNRISRFGADGEFRGFIGSSGQGPGEYDAVVGLAWNAETLFVQLYDGRILLYSSDGAYLSEWRAGRPLAQDHALTPVRDSLLVLKTTGRAEPEAAFLVVSARGEVLDSVPWVATPWDHEVGRGQSDITPSRSSIWSPADFGVSVVGSRLAFQKLDPQGSVLRLLRDYEPATFLADERADWEAQNRFLRQRSGDPSRFPPVPDHKPVVRRVFSPPSGEIWLLVATPSIGPDPGHIEVMGGLRTTPEWLEPLRMEVFGPNGDYLGAVTGPPGLDVRAVGDGVIWAYRNGALGEQHIVRLRVERP